MLETYDTLQKLFCDKRIIANAGDVPTTTTKKNEKEHRDIYNI